nr:hypothetical protein [uncultured Celeribacter sp.]
MADVQLVKTRFHAGVYEGELRLGAAAGPTPQVDVSCFGKDIGVAELTPIPDQPGIYALRFALPAEALSDGVQTFLFVEHNSGATLGSLPLIAGEALAEDLRAEMDLMREELDLLKRAFRRHCIETGMH